MQNNFELLPTDYRAFYGASKAELGYGNKVVDGRFIEHVAPNGQLLGIYETKSKTGDDAQSDRTIIMPASHDYRIEPNWMTRADIIASSANARVILVDMPGTTGLLHQKEGDDWEVYQSAEPLDGAKQTPRQLQSALKGDFTPHAEVQLGSIIETVGLSENEEIILLGESMGAAVVTDMLAVADQYGLSVNEVILYETVNPFKGYRPTVPLHLMKVLSTTEINRRSDYIAENSAIGHRSTSFEMDATNPWQKKLDSARKTLSQQAIAAGVNGLGMANGIQSRLFDTLKYIPKNNQPLLTMVRGNESTATNAKDYEALHDALQEAGMDTRMYSITDAGSDFRRPMGHSLTFSLARQKQVADTLFSQEN